VTSNELSARRLGLLATVQSAIARDELFAGLFILGCVNGLLGRIIFSLSFGDWTGAITGSSS
jgi:hypothetical protein